ncbi:hypothetical protein FLP10_06340 [Agromyces intestinalis]|uniref:Uncharacterized protein n=1 Tax=Agromyces intestinalis TaxID=2592652 RepID=A0A5C1YDG1_9MICO|nr:hypothetical protein [Agromyces intestinalis]QEO14084.1 hypothetical protein FLP10_06340 [Agromyces intestinalis]
MNPQAPERRRRGRASPTRPTRARLRAPGVRAVLSGAGAMLVGVLAAVLMAGGSTAFLTATTPVGTSGTLMAGTSNLLIGEGANAPAQSVTIPAGVYQGMLPGDFIGHQLILHNTGDVEVEISMSLSSVSAWETRVATGACPATVLPGAALGPTPVVLVSDVAAEATVTVCLQLLLPLTTPASTENTSASFTVVFDSRQTGE